jgi:hypothetical protein
MYFARLRTGETISLTVPFPIHEFPQTTSDRFRISAVILFFIKKTCSVGNGYFDHKIFMGNKPIGGAI